MYIRIKLPVRNKIKCNVINIPQEVKVRKYEIDILRLQQLLRSHKNISNKEISEKLNIKRTTVDHWFRTDKCFSIPDENVWLKLKELLHIKTDEFDKSIMEFEYRLGVYEKSERCYLIDELCPTITTSDDIKIISLGNASTKDSQAGKIYSINGLFPTVCACTHGYAIGYIMTK